MTVHVFLTFFFPQTFVIFFKDYLVNCFIIICTCSFFVVRKRLKSDLTPWVGELFVLVIISLYFTHPRMKINTLSSTDLKLGVIVLCSLYVGQSSLHCIFIWRKKLSKVISLLKSYITFQYTIVQIFSSIKSSSKMYCIVYINPHGLQNLVIEIVLGVFDPDT